MAQDQDTTPAVAPAPRTWNERALTTMLAVQFAVFGIVLGVQGVVFAEVMTHLALSDGVFGTAQLALPLAGIVVLVFNGPLYTRLGNKRQSMLSVGLLGAGMLVLAAAGGLPGFVAALLLSGLGFALLDAATSSSIMDIERATGRHRMNFMHGLQSGAIMLGAFVTGLALAGGLSYQTISVLTAAVICAPIIPITVTVAFISADESMADEEQGDGALLRNPAFLAIALICFLGSAAEAIAVVWTVIFMRELDASISLAGLALAVFNGTMLAGRFVNGPMVSRLGAPFSLLVSGIGVTVSAIPLLAWDSVPVAIGAFGVLGLSVAGVQPTALSAAAPLAPNTGAITAFIMISAYLALLVAPVGYGWAAELASLRTAMALVAGCGLAAALLALSVRRRTRPPAEA
ncbi:MFS transporter [Actinomadura chibensis]|uniref:MFS transporter n=1 Tax=Actinomadura chibensis TaxID=392828 RepID=A0A5D0NXW4_9ACTN|nr:MFS transporter [Actinomadura chibensis]TYB49024.1 MFS transporter [Actinomadura chibensis]